MKLLSDFRKVIDLLPQLREMAEDSARLDWLNAQGHVHFDGECGDYAHWHKDWHVRCSNDTGRAAMATGRDYLRTAIDAARQLTPPAAP